MTHILITGGSRGIGAATALGAAANGWNVTFSYAGRADKADEVVRACARHGVKALAVQADASDEAATLALFDAAEAAHGPIDGLVVNAGVLAQAAPLAEMEADRLKRIFDVNVYGAVLTAREGARRLPDGAAMVILSSAAARLGSPNEFVDYAASKGAMDTLTIGLSKELGRRMVRVNGVRPGLIDTDIHADSGQPDRVRDLMANVPMPRAGEAREVADAILYLLSDKASYISGTILDVAGGR